MGVKAYAHRRDERDVIPFEIIERISSQTLVVRDMICDLSNDFKPRIVMGTCLNNDEQRWDIRPDPEGLSFRIRLLKDRRWKDVTGNRYTLDEHPERWHHFGRF